MRRTRWPAGFAVLALIALVGAAPTEAAAKPKLFRFKIKTAMQMDWQWPVNPFNQNRRSTDSHDVLSGSGCGTKPARARWKIKQKSEGLPASTLIIDFVFGGAKNPAKIRDAQYSGTPQADMQIFLRFSRPKNPSVKLIGKPTGDILGPNFSPAKSKLSRKRVERCPL